VRLVRPPIVALALGLALAASAVAFAWPRPRCGGLATRLDTIDDCGACGVRCASEQASAACVAGRCQLACAPGHADCDGHPGNGCEVDLASDRHHCGLCGRDCAGAACVGGLCAARYLGRGADVAADDRAAYAVRRASVLRVPLDGAEPTELTLAEAPPSARAASRRRVSHGADVYWIEEGPGEGGSVRRAAQDGSAEATLVAHPVRLRSLAVNATHVFWVDARDRVFMAPRRR
jgi:hypothetical protein